LFKKNENPINAILFIKNNYKQRQNFLNLKKQFKKVFQLTKKNLSKNSYKVSTNQDINILTTQMVGYTINFPLIAVYKQTKFGQK